MNSSFIEIFLRKTLGILLLLSAFPLLINFITLPLVIFCVIFASYMIWKKKYNLTFNIFALIIGIILFFGVLNSLKVILLYTVSSNNDFRGFLLFGPALILLLISALFMFIHGIWHESSSSQALEKSGWISFGIVFAIILIVLGLPMIKPLEVKIGEYNGLNPNGSRQNAIVSFDENSKEWVYVIKRKNETDKPLILPALFFNKKQITETSQNVTIENGKLANGKLTIEPYKEVTITVRSSEPFYTATFEVENQLADSYAFIK